MTKTKIQLLQSCPCAEQLIVHDKYVIEPMVSADITQIHDSLLQLISLLCFCFKYSVYKRLKSPIRKQAKKFLLALNGLNMMLGNGIEPPFINLEYLEYVEEAEYE